MAISKKEIEEYTSNPAYRPVKVRELARKLKVQAREYRSFRRLVKDMLASGTLVRLHHGRIGLPETEAFISGALSMTRSGRGYVASDDGSGEIAVPPHLLAGAIDGDMVLVRLNGSYLGGKPVGEIIKVTDRQVTQIVGNYKPSRYGDVVEPDSPRYPEKLKVPTPKGLQVAAGMKVVAAVDPWQSPYQSLSGKIIKILGYSFEPGVDVLAIIHQHSLPTEFPAAVERQATAIPAAISEAELQGRLDLRRKVVFTIDPEDAKDFDDAVSLERLANGYRLGVHIADVSFYVAAGSRLDKEARSRCFSAYLADRVLPMLPERLSNDLCSLREKEDRLTISAIIDLDETGRPGNYEIRETVIRSRARLTYEQVQEFLESGKGFEKKKRVGAVLKLMEPVCRLLLGRRLQAGSLDLEQPEYRLRLDAEGKVSEIIKKKRSLSNRLIEEFMLVANQVVAREFLSRNIPTLYRVHAPPEQEKIESFIAFARSLGLGPAFGSPPQTKLMSRFIAGLKGDPEEELLTDLLIRSLQKAAYQPDNIGHFGLGFPHYLHFTSPIRRYPDLMVHRLLRQVWTGSYRPSKAGPLKSSLKRLGRTCTEQEINIMSAEMETLKAKQVEYLSHQLGEVFAGVISGMLPLGFFVRLRDIGAEGLVRLPTLRDDYYQVDLDSHTAVGKRGGRSYRLGDKVMVQVVNVSIEAREIDLLLVEDNRGRTTRRRGSSRKRGRR